MQRRRRGRKTKFDTGSCYAGSNTFAVTVANPARNMLTVRLAVDDGQGAASGTRVCSAAAVLEPRVRYPVLGREPVHLTFSCTVETSEEVVIRRTQRVYVEPFRKELADATERVTALRALLPQLADLSGIGQRVRDIEGELSACREKALVASALSMTVWDTPLPAEQPLRLCHWGYVHASALKDQPDAALQDQVVHGTNVFVCTFAPRASYNENGALVGPIDFAEHDAFVRRHAPHGIILSSIPARGWSPASAGRPFAMESRTTTMP